MGDINAIKSEDLEGILIDLQNSFNSVPHNRSLPLTYSFALRGKKLIGYSIPDQLETTGATGRQLLITVARIEKRATTISPWTSAFCTLG